MTTYCPACGGAGKTHIMKTFPFSIFSGVYTMKNCPRCDGSGFEEYDDEVINEIEDQ